MALTRPRYSQIYDTDYKQSVRAATTGPVGNLLATSNMTNTVDGVTLAVNDRILVKDQADAKQNGIYFVLTLGTGADGTWRRSLDADGGNSKVTSGMTTTVTEGSDNASKTFKLSTPDPILVGTTELTFVNPFVITATAGGANTQIQFNDTGGALGASAGLTFNKTSNILTSTGNVVSTSGYFLGNGALLTGITVDATKIESGNSNVRAFSSGNVAVSVAGTSNVAVFTTDGITMRTGSEIRGHTVRATNGLLTNVINPTSGSNVSLSSIYNFNNVNNIWSSNVYTTNEVSIGGNLTVAGNLAVTGDLTYLNVDNIVTQDALIYVAEGNQFDFLDIGIVGNFTKNSFNQHGGIVRDASDSIWKFFANVEAEPTTTVDFGSATYDSILAGNVLSTGNVVVGANITLNGRLFAGGSAGNGSDVLISTGSGVSWTALDKSSLEFDTSSLVLDNVWGNLILNNTSSVSFADANSTSIFHSNVEVNKNLTANTITVDMTTANTITTVLTRGADNNFQLTAQNGVEQNLTSTEVARFGINHSGTGWDSFTQYIRGSSSQNGSMSLWASNTRIANITSSGLTVTGNVNAGSGYFLGNGSQLTGLPSSYGNTQVASYLPTYSGVLGSSNLQVTGGGTFSGTLTVGGNTVLTTGGGGTITGGVRFTAFNLGNTSGATITPNPLNGNYQYCVNNGSPTAFNAPSSDCAIDILISNFTGAGAITFTGYTVVSGNAGDALTVTTTARFIMSIRRINGISTYVIKQIAL